MRMGGLPSTAKDARATWRKDDSACTHATALAGERAANSRHSAKQRPPSLGPKTGSPTLIIAHAPAGPMPLQCSPSKPQAPLLQLLKVRPTLVSPPSGPLHLPAPRHLEPANPTQPGPDPDHAPTQNLSQRWPRAPLSSCNLVPAGEQAAPHAAVHEPLSQGLLSSCSQTGCGACRHGRSAASPFASTSVPTSSKKLPSPCSKGPSVPAGKKAAVLAAGRGWWRRGTGAGARRGADVRSVGGGVGNACPMVGGGCREGRV